MQDTVKIGAAAIGGYLLGRTKKAKMAISMALWLSGRPTPRTMARKELGRLLESDIGQELVASLRGPVVEASRQAAVSVLEAQVTRLGDTLQRRTEKLTSLAATSAGQGGTPSEGEQQASGGQGEQGEQQVPSQQGGEQQAPSEQQASSEQGGEQQASAQPSGDGSAEQSQPEDVQSGEGQGTDGGQQGEEARQDEPVSTGS